VLYNVPRPVWSSGSQVAGIIRLAHNDAVGQSETASVEVLQLCWYRNGVAGQYSIAGEGVYASAELIKGGVFHDLHS